jgi:hypothetical protein
MTANDTPRPAHRANQSRNGQRRRGSGKQRVAQGDLWRSAGAMPDVVPIEAPRDVGALLRSLGDPPVHGGTAIAHYVAAVAERAAAVAVALALSVDVLASETHDDDVRAPA